MKEPKHEDQSVARDAALGLYPWDRPEREKEPAQELTAGQQRKRARPYAG